MSTPSHATATTRVDEFLSALTIQSGSADPVISTLVTTGGAVLTLRASDVSGAIECLGAV